MTIFAVIYDYTDDTAARDTHRPEHRAFLGTFDDPSGTVVRLVSGPWVGENTGALLAFTAPDAATLESMLNDDPFHREGLIAQRTVREWDVTYGPWAS